MVEWAHFQVAARSSQSSYLSRWLSLGNCGRNLKSESRCFSQKVVDLALVVLCFKFLGPTIYPLLTVCEYAVNQAAQVAGHSLDRFGGSAACF